MTYASNRHRDPPADAEGSSIPGLLLANAATLLLAWTFHWTVGDLMWPYWVQSVVIGWFARQRMLALHRFSTEGFTSNDQPVPETEEGKRSTAGFFVLHYGIFHFAYFAFLLGMAKPSGPLQALVLIACGVSFALGQNKTFLAQTAADARGRPNLGALMCLPYLRVVPMHIAIILAPKGISGAGALFFMAMKTAADLLMDHVDRRIAENAADAAAPENPEA